MRAAVSREDRSHAKPRSRVAATGRNTLKREFSKLEEVALPDLKRDALRVRLSLSLSRGLLPRTAARSVRLTLRSVRLKHMDRMGERRSWRCLRVADGLRAMDASAERAMHAFATGPMVPSPTLAPSKAVIANRCVSPAKRKISRARRASSRLSRSCTRGQSWVRVSVGVEPCACRGQAAPGPHRG